ncbi:MAG TPA: CHAT domain-containing protein, partial [Vicinamibacteria bacterium]
DTLFPPPRTRGERGGSRDPRRRPGEARRLYDVARSLMSGRRLDIIFTSMIDWVADKPWEFAFDPGRRAFLATEEINFLRNVLTSVPADELPPVPHPFRVLVAVAQPLGTAPLSSKEEVSLIRRGFRDLEEAGLATIEVATGATPDLLHRRLQASHFEVLHFIGHGEYDEAQRQGFLLFEDGRGGRQRVGADVVRQILGRRGIRLVFLNACETGTGGRADFNRGVAQALVAAGVPGVVANQYKVLDPSATAFAQHFYWALAQGRSLGDASREARIAVNYSIQGEAIDWAVPVVYARNPREVLCRPPAASRVEAVEGLDSRRQRRSRSPRPVRVGLWDVNHVVASLETMARTLTAAQGMYGFEVVEATAPLGTWRLDRGDDEEEGFLHGGRLGERLRAKPRELGLDALFCVTTFRVGDDDAPDLYVWYRDDFSDPDGRTRGFGLISLYRVLERLDPPRLTLERVLANLITGCLSDAPEHRRGPKSCPHYYNAERDVRFLAGPLRFDATCRRRVSRERLPHLVRLLRAFD